MTNHVQRTVARPSRDDAPPTPSERTATTARATETPAALSSTQGVAATDGSARRPRRRHPALGSRIAATGLSAATMFGIVAALGVQTPPAVADTSPPPAVETNVVTVDPQAASPPAVTVGELTDQPIQLTATPVVRAAQPASAPTQAAPVARTNGSR